MPDPSYFIKRMHEIIDGINAGKPAIDPFNFKKIKDFRKKISDFIGDFIYFQERNFILYAGGIGNDKFIGRVSPLKYECSIIDRFVSALDESYYTFNICNRVQEDITVEKIDNDYKNIFYQILKDSQLEKNNYFIIASRYDYGEGCRVITYY